VVLVAGDAGQSENDVRTATGMPRLFFTMPVMIEGADDEVSAVARRRSVSVLQVRLASTRRSARRARRIR
jgi:hypothetical protein